MKRFLLSMILIFSTYSLLAEQVDSHQLYRIPSSSNPAVSRVYGDYFASPVEQSQNPEYAGVLDDLFGSNGSLNINAQLAGAQARAVQALSDGTFLVALSTSASDSKVVKYNSNGSLATFGISGIADLGSATLVAQTIMLDPQGRILVAGGNDTTSGTAGWLKRVAADGTGTPTSFATGTHWQFIGALAQQASGKIIAVGGNNSHAQVARFNLDGTIDTTFAVSGYINFNGSNDAATPTNHAYPTSPNGVYNVVVDANNLIYVAYVNFVSPNNQLYVTRFTAAGNVDTTWATAGTQAVSYFTANPTFFDPTQVRMVLDASGDLVIALTEGSPVHFTVKAIKSVDGTNSSSFSNFAALNSYTYALRNLITSADGLVYVIGSDISHNNMMVVRLTNTGILDTNFNGTGYDEFNLGGSSLTGSYLYGASIAGDGKLYVAGYQVNGGVTVPYVSRFFNPIYSAQFLSYPEAQEQGIIDTSFGVNSVESRAGFVYPFNGLYGSTLQQKARFVTELASGDMLIGMDGWTNSSPHASMMLTWLQANGTYDTAFGSSTGKIAFANEYEDEYLSAVVEDHLGNLYIAGTGIDDVGHAILRKYDSTGVTQAWEQVENGNSYAGVDVQLQGITRVLFFVQDSATTGHISGYTVGGLLDSTFGDGSSGYVYSTSFGMNMGPVYSSVVNTAGDIFVAYKNSVTGYLDVAAIKIDGSGLITQFAIFGATSGIYDNVFGLSSAVGITNARLGIDDHQNILVATIDPATPGNILVARLDSETGLLDTNFNGTGFMTVSVPDVTSLSISDITGMVDNSMLLTVSDSEGVDVYVARVTGAGILDTTFNNQSSDAGLLPIKIGNSNADYYAPVATCLAVQSHAGPEQGNLVVVGYEQITSTTSKPVVARVFGNPGVVDVRDFPLGNEVVGIVDTTFGSGGYEDFTSMIGAGSAHVIYVYPSGNVYEGKMLIGVALSASTTVKIARVDVSDLVLDTSFAGGSGIVTINTLGGITHLSVDRNNKIIAAGSYLGHGWVQQIPANGVGTIVSCNVPSGVVTINHVAQQQSGRFIVAGKDNVGGGNGHDILLAFQDRLTGSNTTYSIDPSFNPLAVGSAAGRFVVGTSGGALNSITINSDDTILAVCDNETPTAQIAKIKADGSGLVQNFGISGSADTGIVPDNASGIRLTTDAEGKVIVALISGGFLNIVRLLEDGSVIDPNFNGQSPIVIDNIGLTGVNLATVMATQELSGDGKIIAVGYNSSGENGKIFAVRLAPDGTLDNIWNPNATGTDVPGVLTFTLDSSIAVYSTGISVAGNIYAAGLGSINKPLLFRILGDNYREQVVQEELEVASGLVDTTLDAQLNGTANDAASLSSYLPGKPKKIFIYPVGSATPGAMLIASNHCDNSYVTKLNADFTLAGVNGTPTFGTDGTIELEGYAVVNDLFVGIDNSLFVTGCDSGAMWGAHISADGTIANLLGDSDLTSGYAIRTTTNQRILVAGYNGTSGIIAAFNSDESGAINPDQLDLSFGNGSGTGYYTTGVANPIMDMVVDSLNRIYIAYKSGSTIVVQRLLANGTAVDPLFSATSISETSALSSTQIRLALDVTNQQLVVAVQDGSGHGNQIKVARYSTALGTAGNSTGAVSGAITIMCKTLNLSDLFIDTLQDIYVIGYNSTDNNSLIARVASTITLDSPYASAGIANVSTSPLTLVTAGALNPDRRVYLVGYDGCSGYMARVFGDIYTGEDVESIALATVGTLDLTIDGNDATPVGAISITGVSNSLLGYSGKLVRANYDGTSIIAFGNGSNIIIGKFDADMNLITSFGGNSTGYTTPIVMVTINGMTIDANGNIVVSGTKTSGAIAYRYSSNGYSSIVTLPSFPTTPTDIHSTVGTAVAQQKSGRYILGGKISGNGAVMAYQNTAAAIDNTFGPASLNGYYSTGIASQVDNLVIDNNDDIYIVYRAPTGSAYMYVAKVTANGSGLDAVFNNGSALNTNIIATDIAYIAINDTASYILVGAKTLSGIQTYLINATTGVQVGATAATLTSLYSLTGLVGSGEDFLATSFYAANPTYHMDAFRILGYHGAFTDAQIDPNFGVSGIAVSDPLSARAVYGTTIQPDGRIMMVGSNGSNPIVMRYYGYPYAGLLDAQAPDQVAAGLLDTTLNPADSGALNLYDLTTDATLNGYIDGGTIKRMHAYTDGTMLLVVDNGNNTTLVKLNKDLTLDTAFATVGYLYFATNYGNTTGLFIDSRGRVFVSGTHSGAGWIIARAVTGGPIIPSFTPFATLNNEATVISEQALGRIILAGRGYHDTVTTSTNGIIIGYTKYGAADASFGNVTLSPSIVDTGLAAPVADFTIDSLDRIWAVSVVGAATVVQQISENGSVVTTMPTAGSAISTINVTGNNAAIIQDYNGNIIVAAATSTGVEVRRYSSVDGSDLGAPIVFSGVGIHLGNIYATSDGKVTLVGNDSSGNVIAMRIDSSFNLDATFNSGFVLSTPMGSLDVVYDGMIHADDRIMVVGGNGTTPQPYIGRVFGDTYVTYDNQAPNLWVDGTLDPTFENAGMFNLSGLNGSVLNSAGKVIIPLVSGGNYIAFDNLNNASQVVRLTNADALDTTYNATGISATAPQGVHAMFLDGLGRIVITGTNSSNGWVQRYTTAGVVDTTFNGGVVTGGMQTASVTVEQTMGRLVVAGLNASGKAALHAYTNLGVLDTTFNSLASATNNSYGTVPGEFSFPANTNPIYALLADSNDRLIIAYKNGSNIDLARLRSSGILDTSFGINGIVSGVIANAGDATQVRIVFDSVDNIVVAAQILSGGQIAVVSYDNLSAVSGNGEVVNAQIALNTGLVGATVADMIATNDGNILVMGNESGTNAMWVARLLIVGSSAITLDTVAFNPDAIGGVAGIFKYAGAGTSAHVYYSMAARYDGRLSIVGYELSGPTVTPNMIRMYNNPFETEEVQTTNSQPIGTNDFTFGLADATEVTFFALSGTEADTGAQLQVARAVGLQDDNSYVVALDGHNLADSSHSRVFLNLFNIDGTADLSFNSTGQMDGTPLVSGNPLYPNMYVNDMITFSLGNVNKAILAGYVTSGAPLNVSNAVLMQYNLTTPALDSLFGGYDEDPSGVARSDAQAINVVGRQNSGRIVAGGLDQSGNGLLFGYTASGKIDQSFGIDGNLVQGTTGIYAQVIDSNDNIVIAYNDGSNNVAVARILADGSGLDLTFGTDLNGVIDIDDKILNISGNTNLRIALDQNGKIVVVAISGTNIVIRRYTTAGAVDVTLTTTFASIGAVSTFTISKLLVDADGKAIVVGSASYASGTDKIVILRAAADLSALDDTFNNAGTPGYLAYNDTISQKTHGAMIHPNGTIGIVGSQIS